MEIPPQKRKELFDSYMTSHKDRESFPEWFLCLCLLESLEAMKRAEREAGLLKTLGCNCLWMALADSPLSYALIYTWP